jgi:hypothetical protein
VDRQTGEVIERGVPTVTLPPSLAKEGGARLPDAITALNRGVCSSAAEAGLKVAALRLVAFVPDLHQATGDRQREN